MLELHRTSPERPAITKRVAAQLGPTLITLALAGISFVLDYFGNIVSPVFTIAFLCASILLLIVGIGLILRQSRQNGEGHVTASALSVDASSFESLSAEFAGNQNTTVVGDRNFVIAPSPPASEPQSLERAVFYDRLQGAKLLVDSGRHQAAIDTLKRLRVEAAKTSLPADFHATLANRLGAAYLGLNSLEDAESELQAATRIIPNHLKASVNLASLRVHKGDPGEALRITDGLLADVADNPSIGAIRIKALHHLQRDSEIDDFMARFPEIAATPTVKETVARIRLAKDQPEAAVSLARDVVAAEPSDPSHKHLLGQCLLAAVVDDVGTHPRVPWMLESDVQARVEEASDVLTAAIASMEQREEPQPLRSALLNRAHARMILQRLDEALDDCRRAGKLGSDDDHLRELAARILLQVGQPAEAHELLSAIDDQNLRTKLLPLQASALVGDSRLQEAIELLRPVWDTAPENSVPIEIGSILIEAYIISDNHKEAAAVLDRLRSNGEADGRVLAAAARFAARIGRTVEATKLFEEALCKAETNEKDWVALDFADYLAANGDFRRSVDLYQDRVPIDRSSPYLRNYLAALWNSEQIARLFDVTGRLRTAGISQEIVDELHARCLIEAGDMVGATAIWRSLIDRSDSPSRYRLEAAVTAFQAGDQAQARHLVSQISVQDMGGESLALMQLAQLRHSLGLEEVLPYAYAAWRQAPRDAKIHGSYIQILQSREDIQSELLASTLPQVATDTTIFLRCEDHQAAFTIHNRLPPNPTDEDITESDSTAAKLLGRRVGDPIDFGTGRSFEITEIRSKYAVAAARAITGFEDRFPDNPAFQSFPVDPELSALREQVTRRSEFIDSVVDHYRGRTIPLATVAQATNTSVIEVWGSLTNRSNEEILAWQGDSRASQDTIDLASRGAAVLDSTALLALATIGRLEVVRTIVPRLVVPQAVLDEFIEHYVLRFHGKKPVAHISSDGERLTYALHSEGDWQFGKNFIEEIIRFITSYTERTPAPTYLRLDSDQSQKLTSVLGKSSLIPVLVAAELGEPLYSDDQLLRALAQNEYNVRGIWSGAVMAAARNGGKINPDEYSKSICNLISLNYYNVPVGSADLVWLFKHEGQQASDLFRRVTGQLSVPHCDEASAVAVAAEATKLAWTTLALFDRKQVFVDEIIRALLTGRLGTPILKQYRRHLGAIASRPALPESYWAAIDRMIENRSSPTPLVP